MATWNVRALAEERGFTSAYYLALESKLPINTVRPLWNGTAKAVHLKTLERLAAVLNVDAEDLIRTTETRPA